MSWKIYKDIYFVFIFMLLSPMHLKVTFDRKIAKTIKRNDSK